MNEELTVRIGLTSARELEIVVEDGDDFAAAYEKAIKGKQVVFWVTDIRGHRYGVSVDSVAFVEIDKPLERGVGF